MRIRRGSLSGRPAISEDEDETTYSPSSAARRPHRPFSVSSGRVAVAVAGNVLVLLGFGKAGRPTVVLVLNKIIVYNGRRLRTYLYVFLIGRRKNT